MENMKSIKIAGLCLVAVFAFSAVAASSAFGAGQPEYKLCGKAPKVAKKGTGVFSDKECTVAATESKYRLEEVPVGKEYTSKIKKPVFNVDGKEIACKKAADKEIITSHTTDEDTITFEKCDIVESKTACPTFTTDTLKSELYYTNTGETELGILFEGSEGGGPWATIVCGAETFNLTGYLAGSVLNTSKGETITFAVSGGKQAIENLDAFGFEFGELVLKTADEREATLAANDEVKAKGLRDIG